MQTWNFSFDIVRPRLITRQSMSLDCRFLGVVSPERTFRGTGAHYCVTSAIIEVRSPTPAAFATTRISHEKFAIGSVPRQAPTLEDLVASATEQCAPVLGKV